MTEKSEIREEMTNYKLGFLAEIGSELDISKEQAEKEEQQAIGAVRGLIDAVNLINQLALSFKDDAKVQEFKDIASSKMVSLKERLETAMIQKKAKKEALSDVVKRIEAKYQKIESIRDSKFIGVSPKEKAKNTRKKKQEGKDAQDL